MTRPLKKLRLEMTLFRTTWFACEKQWGLYNNKVMITSSLVSIHRLAHWAWNCKMGYLNCSFARFEPGCTSAPILCSKLNCHLKKNNWGDNSSPQNLEEKLKRRRTRRGTIQYKSHKLKYRCGSDGILWSVWRSWFSHALLNTSHAQQSVTHSSGNSQNASLIIYTCISVKIPLFYLLLCAKN